MDPLRRRISHLGISLAQGCLDATVHSDADDRSEAVSPVRWRVICVFQWLGQSVDIAITDSQLPSNIVL